jgi:carbamoyltransferase
VLEEAAADYFELKEPERHYPARYMLVVSPIHADQQDKIAAVNHLGTGRLQTVRCETNPNYYAIVDKFGQATGVPVVLNTSFNLRGEPIVNEPANAWWTFHNSGIDLLVMGHYVVGKDSIG